MPTVVLQVPKLQRPSLDYPQGPHGRRVRKRKSRTDRDKHSVQLRRVILRSADWNEKGREGDLPLEGSRAGYYNTQLKDAV